MLNENKTDKVEILGLKVDNITMTEAAAFIEDTIADGNFARVVTLNAEIAYLSYDDKDKASLVNGADLVTPDGSGIMWAGEQYGCVIKERVSGIDLTEKLFSVGQKKNYKFYCLGAKEEVVKAAVSNIEKKYNVNVVGWRNGYFPLEESESIAREIKSSGAQILLVAMGFPRQDKWIADYGALTGVNVALGIGGSFDVFAGLVKRAPVIWQRLRLEWLYRLLKDPRRIKRVLNLPKFMRAVKKDAAQRR